MSFVFLAALMVGSGEPAWVNRGSGAFPADKRTFYGMGSANGIKNPSLLRTTADNRARAELAKVFETYSASLMKDYSSSDAQNVQQAVKTFSASSQQGAEVVDRYTNAQGVMYSLCKLDLDRAKDLIAAAQASGAIRSFAKDHADKAYDDLNQMMSPGKKSGEVQRPPPPTNGGSAPTTTAKVDGVKTRSGRPAWVDGEDSAWPWNKYLYAVGFGKDRTAAENGAVAGLAKIFETHVQQTALDFQQSVQNGNRNLEVQDSQQLTKTTVAKSLSDVRVAEIYQDNKVSTTYALAALERAVIAAGLRDRIAQLDAQAQAALDRATPDDKVKQLRALNQTVGFLAEREALNTDLRIVEASGVGAAPQLSYADVLAKLGDAQESLNVGIMVTGTQGDDVRAALAQGLTQLGYSVKEIKGDDEDDTPSLSEFDIVIIGKVRAEKAGQIQGGAFEMVRAVADFQLKNVKKNKIIDEYTVADKEGHKSVQEAQRRAIRELNKIVAPQLADRFQKYLSKK